MHLTITVSDEQAAVLRAQAAARGLSLEDWLQQLAAQQEQPGRPAGKLTSEERARRFRAWLESHDPKTPVLSDEAMSRDAIYPDRL